MAAQGRDCPLYRSTALATPPIRVHGLRQICHHPMPSGRQTLEHNVRQIVKEHVRILAATTDGGNPNPVSVVAVTITA